MKNIYPPGTDKKPSVFNFDPATTYNNSERLDIGYCVTNACQK